MTINIVIIISVIAIIISLVGIIVSSRFQAKQKSKYNVLERLISENKDLTFKIKDGLSQAEISKIDSNIDITTFMSELYELYLTFINKTNELDTNFSDVLTDDYKEMHLNKINNFKDNGYKDIIENIDLIGYSINEFSKQKVKFRVNINCHSYKTLNDDIVSGSNTYKVERIDLVTYKKIDNRWLISFYDTVYEKKLSN